MNFPRIKFVDQLPQWVLSSDIGAYSPFYKVIWIKKGMGMIGTAIILIHELGHWIIDICLFNKDTLHKIYDKITTVFFSTFFENVRRQCNAR